MAEGSSFQSFIKDFTFTPATATTNINADIKTKMQMEDEEEEGEEASLRNAPSPNKSGDGDLALTLAPATCLAGIMGGGNLAVVNLTLPAAVTYCLNNAKCAGFTAENPTGVGAFPAVCNSSSTMDVTRTVYFKDYYGAERRSKNAAFASWVVSHPKPTPPPPPPPAPPAPPAPALVFTEAPIFVGQGTRHSFV